jgi:hypothetical protein
MLRERSINIVDGFVEEDIDRMTIAPIDVQKVKGSTFCKANKTYAKAPLYSTS